ncbi:MAG: long-chain fatty acid--CoA ligase, partial [Actinobacteria bacterium]|nr:long-chain fatty acid--CoA ligase [Actinomycetota bacterium]
ASLFALLENSAARFPDGRATAFFGAHMKWSKLLAETERFSSVLAGLGVGKGDRVGLILPNCPQYVIAYYATVRLGAIVVGNNPLYTDRDLQHQIEDSGPKVVVTLDAFWRQLMRVSEMTHVGKVVVTSLTDYMPFPINKLAPLKFKKDTKEAGREWPFIPKGQKVLHWKAAMKSAGPAPPVAVVDAKADAAGFIYTGGTTGPAKGAMLSHYNLTANAMHGASWFSTVVDGQDAMMCALPFFHSFGMLAMNFAVYRAAKIIMVPRFDLPMVLKAIQKEKPSLFPGVPRIYIALNQAPDVEKYDLRSIKACVSGAAPLPVAVADRFREVTGGGEVVEGYGLTECSPVTHANPFNGVRKPGHIGLPVPDTECKITALDEPDRVLPPGEAGELCIRGPQMMLGYWNRPDETGSVIRDGWFHTGDVAVMDEDGYFKIVDRLKDMILVSGFNVYPTEIERVLYHHPKIQKVCVAGIPDATTGEAVKAYIVLKEGETATVEEIVQWCRDPGQGLTGYRVPKQIEFRDSLPETLIGKVLRRVLQQEERAKSG